MLELLGATGAQRAERSLFAFLEQVRAAAPHPGPNPHHLVLRAGLETLERRCLAADAAFDALFIETLVDARGLSSRVRAALAQSEALSPDAGPERSRDLAIQRSTLSHRAAELQERLALLRRAMRWLDNVSDTMVELSRKDARHQHGVDAPGLLRTLTELGAHLSAITDAAEAARGKIWGHRRVPSANDAEGSLSPTEARRAFTVLARDLDRIMSEASKTEYAEDENQGRRH